MAHLSDADRVAAGLRALPDRATSFAAAQAAWRFFSNGHLTLPQLATPLLEAGVNAAARCCTKRTLIVLDWSLLHYGHHHAKADRMVLMHKQDLGYKLLTALAVSDTTGKPLAPLCLELQSEKRVYTTRHCTPLPPQAPLDSLEPVMAYSESMRWAHELVFVIDREGDSAGHLRQWDEAGREVLVRAKDNPKVLHAGREKKLSAVAKRLALKYVRKVSVRGIAGRQYVGEAIVSVERATRTHRMKNGKEEYHREAGRALKLRLIVSVIKAANGKVLARWLLLTNLPAAFTAERIALWYYWRWKIECYHKLLKNAGQHVESWLQREPNELARRLVVVAMSCVLVWQLARDTSPEAKTVRDILVRLSGRQMKRGPSQPGFTEPGLLAGLGILLPMLCLLEDYSLGELRALVRQTIPVALNRQDSG